MKTLKEIMARKAEIRTILEEDASADLVKLEEELRDLNERAEAFEKRSQLMKEAEEVNAGQEHRTLENFNQKEERGDKVDAELRGQDLLEKRAVTVATGELVLAKHTSNQVNGTFNQVSSLIDAVAHVNLPGGESYRSGYEKGHGEGDYTAEGANYSESDVEFGYADINKVKITSYSEESEEVRKLPAANYSNVIIGGVSKSLRKKITKEILVGDGTTGHLTGIFSSAATAIDPATDLEVSQIDADTLDNIVFSYGGDEDVEDTAVLILSKKDVKAFAMLRDGNDKKVYEVQSNGNTGTIDGVPYIINSACAPVTGGTADTFAMAYGPLSNYKLATFSPMTVEHSTEFKFKQGMIAHRGSVFVGGNVDAHNGFLRVKVGAPQA